MNASSREFRDALGQFATGVCIVTAAPEGMAPFGLTVNSFSSVSLDPPLVLWSLQTDGGDCAVAFENVTRFGISVLSAEQQELSILYARRGEHELQAEHVRRGAMGLPLIRDALASFECELWARYPGGDHDILVGKVLSMEQGPAAAPLLYFASRYRELT